MTPVAAARAGRSARNEIVVDPRSRGDRRVGELVPRGLVSAASVLLVIAMYAGRPAELMPTRQAQMEDIIRGPGGLIACTSDGSVPRFVTPVSPGCYRGAVGDDPLMFMLIPPASRATGVPVAQVMKWSSIAALAVIMAILPFAIGRAWPLAPIVLLTDPLRSVDLYWFAPVAYLAAFPLLLQWRWERRWLILLALAAGVLSGFRSGTGLPIIAAALVAGWRRPWRASIAWAAALVVAYSIPGWLLPQTARFWHSIYIGLGYLPNPWVPAYLDEVGIATVARLAPGTPYQSPAFEAVLRGEVIRIALADPAFIARDVLTKLVAIGPALLALAAIVVVGLRRRGLVLAPALALAAAPAIVAVPDPKYLTGLYILIALGLILGVPRSLEVLRSRTPATAPR